MEHNLNTPISVELNEKINAYIAKNIYQTNSDLSKQIAFMFNIDLSLNAIRKRKSRLRNNPQISTVEENQHVEVLQKDSEIHKLKQQLMTANSKIKTLHGRVAELDVLQQMSVDFQDALVSAPQISIQKNLNEKESISTAVVVLSDWHYEENIKPESVNGLNEFNTAIASRRIENCFKNTAKLLHLFRKGTRINDCILALLGDFITNNIHDELVEVNEKLPMEAVIDIYVRLVAGIEFLLDEFPDMKFTAVCKVGNHSRTTKRVHVSTELGHSLEYLLYYFLARDFKNEERVRVVLEHNYLTYVNVYNYTIRFHHGHQIKYNGGVGGITIPVKKAIGMWDKSRQADLDVFGHFHQTVIDKDFICNGSLIGYSPYAVAIKAEYEKPSQTLFLIEQEHGRTLTAPIFLDD